MLKYWKNRIRSKNILDLFRQLNVLINAEIPLAQALALLAGGSHSGSLRQLILAIWSKIENGLSLSETLKIYPRYFHTVHHEIIHAGEQSGKLGELLKLLIHYEEGLFIFKKKIQKAIRYPLTVLSIALGVTIGLLEFVIPQFQNAFSEFGSQLPFFTQVIINLAHNVRAYGLLIFFSFSLFLFVFVYAKKHSDKFSKSVDHALIKIPLIGKGIQNIMITLWIKVLATLSAAGIPLNKALITANHIIRNHALRQALDKLPCWISEGVSFSTAIERCGFFPHQAIQIIHIGENSGTLNEMLNKVAVIYQEEIDERYDRLSECLEPAIMIVLALLIGGLIIAMYLPVFRIGSAL
ncbi:type II secretion system F family protein [Coxiella burnetii]|uniref:Type 4 pili biogenesis protein (Plasma membrane protein) n=1 Tax=Coxiella burnetii (strain RSA 493 / Nine Mile phase I) TaxID=227377 RepID=Q83EZ9_COXBU|nr:type II secretion system F family protein [Coxiella burnetii]NP_819204.1 type 4 pili biogenesis protein [Coxiella burnetii RSA 493]AAO89718.1 type 4 pili biogenesis protein (plasma membrane protein) [Coxiella burnetii RSA 493]ARI65070.1 type 4 fimbrial biosynthesis protein [Coxiella burnetii]ARK26568.1 type 4 fimbrial biosynthesis protein [Coxiella burnetii]MCF2093029.1 type II secretion system F family protein [Coxiella burnetii]MCF2095122.1 type II secretion system F family protein [Coxi